MPKPPEEHRWGGVVHDNTVSWIATWTENVNGNIKYVMFAAGSSLKGMSDLKKFEKARELKVCFQTKQKSINICAETYRDDSTRLHGGTQG